MFYRIVNTNTYMSLISGISQNKMPHYNLSFPRYFFKSQCVKSIRIRSYSGPHFPAFGLNIIFQSECGKILTRINPNTYMSLISGISQNKMPYYDLSFLKDFLKSYCVKTVRIRSYSGPHFPHSD